MAGLPRTRLAKAVDNTRLCTTLANTPKNHSLLETPGMISYDDWMKKTYAMGFRRSPEMQAIDQAIKNFTGGSFQKRLAVIQAMDTWMEKEKREQPDGNWRKSRRNKDGIIEITYKEFGGVIRFRTPEEIAAMGVLRRAYADNLRTLFQGKELQVKDSNAASKTTKEDIKSTADELKKAVEVARKGLNQPNKIHDATEFAGKLCGGNARTILGSSFDQVKTSLGELMPLLGILKGGASLAGKLYTIADNAWMKYRTCENARSSFAPGDPSAALDAVMVCITREMAEAGVDAAMIAAKLAADITAAIVTGGAGVIAGQITSAANAAGKLAKDLYLFSRDQKEIGPANELIRQEQFDLTLFKASPLLGCYVIACSDWSAVVAMAVSSYGKPGFKVQVEVMKKKADPVILKSGDLVRKSRYEIPGSASWKGIVAEKSTLDKLKAKLKDFVIGPEHKEVLETGRIEGMDLEKYEKLHAAGAGTA